VVVDFSVVDEWDEVVVDLPLVEVVETVGAVEVVACGADVEVDVSLPENEHPPAASTTPIRNAAQTRIAALADNDTRTPRATPECGCDDDFLLPIPCLQPGPASQETLAARRKVNPEEKGERTSTSQPYYLSDSP